MTTSKTYLRREDAYLAHHQDRLTAERRRPAGKLEVLQNELTAAKETLATAEQDVKRDALVEAEEKLREARHGRQDLLRQSGQLEGQISFLERRIKTEKERASQKSERPIAYKEVEAIVGEVEKAAEKAAKQNDVNLVQRALSDVVHTLKRFLQKASEGEVVTTEVEEKELVELQSQMQSVTKELEVKTEAEETAQQAYNAVQAEIEADASESREAEREVFRIVNEQRECEHELQQIDGELAVLERDRNEF